MQWTFELVAGPYGSTTEGPAWTGKALLFSHISASRILSYDPGTSACTEFRINTEGTNGLMFDAEGCLFGCSQRGRCIVRYESDATVMRLPNKLNGRTINRPNDLAIDRKGRIWFSDPNHNLPVEQRELDHSSVLRLDPLPDGHWTLTRMTTDTKAPNGLVFSRDERTLYVAESGYYEDTVRELRAYPVRDDGTMGTFTVLHTFGADARGLHRGIDGMCLDAEGNIVACAGYDKAGPGPLVYVFAPSGRVLETYPVPGGKPTNCTFGDSDLSTLYVTTGAGHLYRVRNTGHRGWRPYLQ